MAALNAGLPKAKGTPAERGGELPFAQRGASKLRLPDAVQVATALETSSIALVTSGRDYSALDGLPERLRIYA